MQLAQRDAEALLSPAPAYKFTFVDLVGQPRAGVDDLREVIEFHNVGSIGDQILMQSQSHSPPFPNGKVFWPSSIHFQPLPRHTGQNPWINPRHCLARIGASIAKRSRLPSS